MNRLCCYSTILVLALFPINDVGRTYLSSPHSPQRFVLYSAFWLHKLPFPSLSCLMIAVSCVLTAWRFQLFSECTKLCCTCVLAHAVLFAWDSFSSSSLLWHLNNLCQFFKIHFETSLSLEVLQDLKGGERCFLSVL